MRRVTSLRLGGAACPSSRLRFARSGARLPQAESRRACTIGFLLLATGLTVVPAKRASAWQYLHDGNRVTALLVEPSGDAISSGLQDVEGTPGIVVVRNSGSNGTEVWRHVVNLGGPTYNSGAYLARDHLVNLIVADPSRGPWTLAQPREPNVLDV